MILSVILFSIGLNVAACESDLVIRKLRMQGYPCERHEVITTDGYVITVHRIPPRNSTTNQRAEVVVLMHGFVGSAADFIVIGKNYGLGNILHDQGYDVWLPNARGTTWSKKHRNLTTNSPEYWNFSWHEIGMYDIPAVIDMALEKTGATKVHYSGHSQGTTVLLVLLSERPEYNDKISTANFLAPIAFLSHIRSPLLKLLSFKIDDLQNLFRNLGLYEFLSSTGLNQYGGRLFCSDDSPFQELCLQLTYFVVGYSGYQFNKSILPEIFETTPAGVSYKQFTHFGQLILSGKFRKFDYRVEGDDMNFRTYGKSKPPDYNLRNIRIPMVMFYGDRDALLAKQDVLLLKSALRHAPTKFIEVQGFNHIDFLYSKEAARLIYRKILFNIRKATPKRVIVL